LEHPPSPKIKKLTRKSTEIIEVERRMKRERNIQGTKESAYEHGL